MTAINSILLPDGTTELLKAPATTVVHARVFCENAEQAAVKPVRTCYLDNINVNNLNILNIVPLVEPMLG